MGKLRVQFDEDDRHEVAYYTLEPEDLFSFGVAPNEVFVKRGKDVAINVRTGMGQEVPLSKKVIPVSGILTCSKD